MKQIVIDLETGDTRSQAAILAIAAVAFDDKDYKLENISSMSRTVDLDSCLRKGCTVGGNTIKWWLQQSEEARAQICGASVPLVEALSDFRNFMIYHVSNIEEYRIWCRGASFDFPILAHAFDLYDTPKPWDFRSERDTRTELEFFDRSSFPRQDDETAHSALGDCMYEARCLMEYWNSIEEDDSE